MSDDLADGWETDTTDLPERLRERVCQDPEFALGCLDHGHTDCWLMSLAANRIEELEGELDDIAAAADTALCLLASAEENNDE